jgi:MFS family permease
MARQEGHSVAVEGAAIAHTSAIGNRRRLWIFVFLFLLNAINYLDRVVLSVDAQPIAKEFALSPIALGYLFSAVLWAYALCQIPVGIILDRWGSRTPIAIGIAFWSLMIVTTGLAGNYAVLLLTRVGLGIGESVTQPAGSKVIRQWIPVRERGMAFTVFTAGVYAGPAFGVALVAWLTETLGWRGAFFVVGGIGFVWLAGWVCWFRPPETARWLSEPERQTILAERDDDLSTPRRTTGAQYATLLKSLSMWGTAITTGCNVYTHYLFLTWMPTYLQTTRNLSMLKSGIYAAIPYITAVVLGVVIGAICDRLLTPKAVREGKRRIAIAILMASSAVILFTPYVEQLWLIVALFSISLTGSATAGALNSALMTELLRDPHSQAKATSLMVICGTAFGVLAPIITGYVVAGTGSYNGAFVSAGVLLIAGTVTVLMATRRPIG